LTSIDGIFAPYSINWASEKIYVVYAPYHIVHLCDKIPSETDIEYTFEKTHEQPPRNRTKEDAEMLFIKMAEGSRTGRCIVMPRCGNRTLSNRLREMQ